MKIATGLYQYTAVDDCSRFRVLGLYKRRTAANTLLFLESVIEEMRFPIQRIQTDRGTEFFAIEVQKYLLSHSIKFSPDVEPISLSQGQIEQMVADFAAAAVRAAEAGFDGVEIHGAHFYLISEFLSPLTNQRNDRYGGDASARATLALEVLRSVRDRLGESYPILFRLNALEKVEGGQTLEDTLVVSKLLAEEGVDALDVSLIANSSWKEIDDRRILVAASAFPKDQPAGANVPPTAAVKEATGLPVIAVGKLGENDLAGESVRDYPIDIVAIGRQMIADPAAAGKILAGKQAEIVRCDECMTCFATIMKGKPMGCKVNLNLPGSRRPKSPRST